MRLFAAFCALLAAALATQARAFPDKPVRLVVPYSAGGSTDLISRALGHELSEMWGQSVVIDDTPELRGMTRAIRFLVKTEPAEGAESTAKPKARVAASNKEASN